MPGGVPQKSMPYKGSILVVRFIYGTSGTVIFIDIQDNVIVKGMGKLSMPVVPGNLISLPNFLGMHSVQ